MAHDLHAALRAAGITADVVPPGTDLSGYPVVLVPTLYLCSDETAAAVAAAAEAGAQVLVTYFSGIVDEHDQVRLGGYPGAFRDLLGVRAEEFFPLPPGEVVALDDGSTGTLWSELLAADDAEVLARYADGPLAGGPALTRRAVGAGAAWYSSTRLDPAGTRALVDQVCAAAGVAAPVRTDGDVEVVRRTDDRGRWAFLVNHADQDATVHLDGHDLVADAPVTGAWTLPAGCRRRGEGAVTVLASQRQDRILEQVAVHGAARVSELVELLGVSDMTVRRDIDALAGRGLVARVHGGVTAAGGRSAEEPGFVAKSTLQITEKVAIAREAVRLVEPGAAVAISAGTTTYEVARLLRHVERLTVVTNSIPVAQLLHEEQPADMTVILTGGIRTPSDALVGPVAVQALEGLHVDWLFMGVHGFDVRAGLTTPNMVEGDTDRALIACARQVVVTADSSKWGVVALTTIAGLDEVDVLVTDSGLPPGAHDVLGERVDRLVVAPDVSSGVTEERTA